MSDIERVFNYINQNKIELTHDFLNAISEGGYSKPENVELKCIDIDTPIKLETELKKACVIETEIPKQLLKILVVECFKRRNADREVDIIKDKIYNF